MRKILERVAGLGMAWTAAWVLAALWPAEAAAQPKELPATVATLAGASEVFAKGADKWAPAKLRTELREGDGARTLVAGRLVLRTGNGHALRLAQLTQVFLAGNDLGAADQPLRVRLDGGWLWVAVTPGTAPRAKAEVRAGPVTVAVRGTGAGIRINRDGSVLVRVYHGAAECAGPGTGRQWTRALADEQELSVASGGVPGDVRTFKRDKVDAAWIKWNEEQDRAGGYGGKPPAR